MSKQISFAVKAPFWKLINLKEAAQQRKRWFRIDAQWSYFWVKQPIDSIEDDHYVLVLRKQLKNRQKPFQLELFSPNNGTYEYSAIGVDSKQWDPEKLLLFVSGRSAQENSIGQLKTNFAFDHIPTNTYQANSGYMQMNQMAHNLAISLQHSMGLASKRKSTEKRTRLHKVMEWKTFRFLILNRAGRIVHSRGKKVLEMSDNPATKILYDKIYSSLEENQKKKAA